MQEDHQDGMTEIMYQYAKEKPSLKRAKEKLRADAYIRTVGEFLSRFCKTEGSKLQKKVTDILCETAGDTANRESIGRKVREWLTKKKTSIDKESAVQLAFALKMELDDAEELLCRLSDENFHWRDPDDIVLMFALKEKLRYCDAVDLLTRIRPLYDAAASEENSSTMTESLIPKISQIQTEDDLKNFISSEAPKLGKLHNTAYYLYTHFLRLLSDDGDMLISGGKRKKEAEDVEEEKIASNILNTYLHRQSIPFESKKAGKILRDALQRSIKQNWPDKYILSRMSNRSIDVSRKVLILLFLACDGGETAYSNLSDESDDDIFEDTYTRLTQMLLDCGFPPIDSRKPFDWMVLYCIAKADDIAEIDGNIEKFLSEIFDDSGH